MLLVYCIGLVSGLPLMLTITVLQAWLTDAQVSVADIGLITLVGLPYTYKFLWAPCVDRYHPRLFRSTHRRKSWIILCQLCLAAVIFSFAFLSPSHHLFLIACLAIILAVFSATQDIVIDAYRTEYLLPEERGLGSAAFIFSYRLATLISGGLGLVFADKFGWQFYFISLACLMVFGSIVVAYLPSIPEHRSDARYFFDMFIRPFQVFLQRKSAMFILIFIILYKFGDAFTQSLGTTFFLRELHLSLSQVGILYKTVGFISTILGAYLGGFLLPNLGLYRGLFIFGLLQAVANLAFVALAHYGAISWLVITAVTLDLCASGMATVALVAYLMALCDIRYTASQFALFTAIMSVGRIGAGPLAGVVVMHWGWSVMFALGFVLSLPSLCLLPKLKASLLRC